MTVESFLSRSSSSRSLGSSRELTPPAVEGDSVAADILPDLSLALPTIPKKHVGVGLAGETPREVREMDALGATGYTPRTDSEPKPSAAALAITPDAEMASPRSESSRLKLLRKLTSYLPVLVIYGDAF